MQRVRRARAQATAAPATAVPATAVPAPFEYAPAILHRGKPCFVHLDYSLSSAAVPRLCRTRTRRRVRALARDGELQHVARGAVKSDAAIAADGQCVVWPTAGSLLSVLRPDGAPPPAQPAPPIGRRQDRELFDMAEGFFRSLARGGSSPAPRARLGRRGAADAPIKHRD